MPKAKKPEVKSEAVAVPAHLETPEQVAAFIGPLTDEQARQVLAEVLKGQAAANSVRDEGRSAVRGRDSGLGAVFYRMADKASALIKKLSWTLGAADAESDHLGDAWRRLTGGEGIDRFFPVLLALFAILTAGLLARGLLFRRTREMRERVLPSLRLGQVTFLGRALWHLILE
ncbi:MAG: hypothetical protein R6X05_11410, partial [Desulfobacterales bacterium]